LRAFNFVYVEIKGAVQQAENCWGKTMERMSQKKEPESKPSRADDLTRAVMELDQRIKDLEDFDVKAIVGRFDAKTKALEDKINETLSDIFGFDSAEYRKYSILTLDTLPIVLGGPKHPLPMLQQAYQKGIDDCVAKLKSLKETLSSGQSPEQQK
jgi:hypothetical protein